jgi:hypothetical protein
VGFPKRPLKKKKRLLIGALSPVFSFNPSGQLPRLPHLEEEKMVFYTFHTLIDGLISVAVV